MSPCGHFVVGGAESGNCHVWSTLGGNLLRTIKAHYRSVTAMTWSDCGQYLITGGADGIVHAFSLMELVDRDIHDSQSIAPVRSWSQHQLPVTALLALSSGRLVSASEDGKIHVLEIFSEKVLATIQFGHAISSTITIDDNCLYVGCVNGSIHRVDLDAFAAHKTAQIGLTVKRRKTTSSSSSSSFTNRDGQSATTRVFGGNNQSMDPTAAGYFQSELRGHNHPVKTVAVLPGGMDESAPPLLISGDTAGVVRVWDLESHGCIRVIQPWSHSARTTMTTTTDKDSQSTSSFKKKQASAAASESRGNHPVTSIHIVSRNDGTGSSSSGQSGPFQGSMNAKETKANSIVNLVSPLQRFPDQQEPNGTIVYTPVPFLQPKRTNRLLDFWNVSTSGTDSSFVPTATVSPALAISMDTEVAVNDGSKDAEIMRLRQELAESKATAARFEAANDKLMARLNKK